MVWLIVLSPLILVVGFVVFCNVWVTASTYGSVFRDEANAPRNAVGVVLGTTKNVGPNRPNLHFTNRMEAAAKLYKSGKVAHLLVSGAKDSRYYNEAKDMTEALTALGVPAAAITKDESGFRTLDSIVRAQRIFGQDRYTIITDDFHVSRAVFIARRNHQDAIGFASEHIDARLTTKTRVREVLARCKAVLDLYILRTQPRELGEASPIQVAAAEES